MPYKIKKVGKRRYKVVGPRGIVARRTSKKMAKAQIRLLRSIHSGAYPHVSGGRKKW